MSQQMKFIWLLKFRTYLVYIFCYILIIMVASGSHIVNGLKCFCNPKECDLIRSQDCPGKGLIVWDPCKCCRMCARTLGEACGGPGGFSGTCEPPLQCVTKLPISSGLGVCMDLPVSLSLPTSFLFPSSSLSLSSSAMISSSLSSPSSISSLATYHLNCTNDQTIVIEEGCEITNKRCQCWPTIKLCKNEEYTIPANRRWHFRTLEDCQLNLQNLIKIEMEFDEDYTISPRSFTYRKFRGKRRAIRRTKRR